MAAMSATHTAATTLTPPSSSHGDQPWNHSASAHSEISMHEKKATLNNENAHKGPVLGQNGTAMQPGYNSSGDITSRKMASNDNLHATKGARSTETSYMTPNGIGSEATKRMSNSPTDNFADRHSTHSRNGVGGDKRTAGEAMLGHSDDDDGSKWIHRDKLARIESEELQAAGIILPRQRAPSRPRRDYRSNDGLNGHRKTADPAQADQSTNTSRKNSAAAEQQRPQDITVPSWDLRLPEEIAAAEANSGFWTPNSLSKGASRIPVAKLSPAPIPVDYLERDSPAVRKPNGEGPGEGETIAYIKPRSRSASVKAFDTSPSLQPAKRSVTDSISPKKGGVGTRKPSTRGPSGGRPKTRSGPNKDSTSSNGTRPSTRSGELSTGPNKHPEGDPPWMVSAYQPDPRLPPDQQLLPTVARRLQQERWEKEGKFGNVYDKEFRPLNDDPFLQPPEAPNGGPSEEEKQQDEWPLKTEGQRNAGSKAGNSYSTMPKIQDKSGGSPLPSPRSPMQQQGQNQPMSPLSPEDIVRVPEQQEERQERKGCGCCIVM